LPATPQSTSYQTLFSGPVTGIITQTNPQDPLDLVGNTRFFAKEFLKKTFLWWYWMIYVTSVFFGLSFLSALVLACATLATVSITYGLLRARNLAVAATSSPGTLSAGSSGGPPATNPSFWKAAPAPALYSSSADPVIGNLALSIYHFQHCAWVAQISQKNRTSFHSPAAALSAGYKPCRVCSPN